ncbi:MAG: ATP-dependent DNA helicase RecG [Pseudomonadota bacterium]|nr:ATP-dependent DNA helicase RecG [Pseudomonadota bacterium]
MDIDIERFARLGIRRAQDLVLQLPLRYEDLTRITPIGDLVPGVPAQVEGEVVRVEVRPRPRRTLTIELADASGRIGLRFFHFYGSQVKQLQAGRRLRVSGEPRSSLFGFEMVHPQYRVAHPGMALPDRLTPVYPSAAGISQASLRRAIGQALECTELVETVPGRRLADLGLPGFAGALRLLHGPPPDVKAPALADRSHPAWRRIILDELLAQQVSLRRARAARSALAAEPLADGGLAARLLGNLPFELTGAQRRAWSRIRDDLARAQPMNRLLQGDVGSGKTVVAALAAAQAIGSGHQVAIMAPTEILADQHARKLRPWFEAIGIRVELLTGSVRERDKRRVREAVATREVGLLIGTHALIEQGVEFSSLGLVVVDEQHRFGVAQRIRLTGKSGERLPHQLMMSATPIPRTLAMTYYADLEVTVIDELPPGRSPIVTRLLPESRREELVERVAAAAGAGRQVYWVCPLIEEAADTDGEAGAAGGGGRRPISRRQREALELQTAIETHRELSETLAPLVVGLVHGRLPAAEKQAVMEAFGRGDIAVLVATTVIEVGVDVPNASLMVVEHAERFGLAQLHQLRGRVGRGTARSACVLMYRAPLSPTARSRLRIMQESNDGFEIARHDLMLRGPGEILGARQSGVPLLRYADLERDADLVEVARELAGADGAGSGLRVDELLDRWYGGREDFLRA